MLPASIRLLLRLLGRLHGGAALVAPGQRPDERDVAYARVEFGP